MRNLTALALSGALLVSATPVRAGNADFIAGAVVGIMGRVVVDAVVESNRGTPQPHSVPQHNAPNVVVNPQPSQAELDRRAAEQALREKNRNIQTWLNSLGFDAGPVDGLVGTRTRSAMSDFQASIGHAPTGSLTDDETSMLYNIVNGNSTNPGAPPTPVPAAPIVASTDPVSPEPERPDSGLPQPSDISDLIAPSDMTAQSMTFEGTELVSANIRRISVLGLTPLADASTIEQSIAGNEYDQCTRGASSLVCTKDTNFMLDTLMVGFVHNQDVEQIHTVTREMQFKNPIARTEMLDYFATPYPQLVAADNQTLSTSDDCNTVAQPLRVNGFEPLKSWSESGTPASPAIGAMADQCEFYYTLSMADTDQIESLDITLFAGGPIVATLTEGGGATNSSLADAQIQF